MKNVVCFVNGEPYLYLYDQRRYSPLKLDYNLTLELVEKYLINLDKRPGMKDVWSTLSNIIGCSECFSSSKCIRNTVNENSFESRFTVDITKFLDKYYRRGLSKEEIEAREDFRNFLKKYYNNVDYYKQRKIAKFLRKKNGCHGLKVF